MQYTIYAILQRQLTLRWKQKKLKKKNSLFDIWK